MNEGIAGIILAGGLSSRMGGGDKALAPLAGCTLLGHVVGRLEPQVDMLALNANGDPARFDAFGLPVVADTVPGFAGPLAGLLAGLEWAASTGCVRLVTAAADTPFFPRDLVERLHGAVATRPDAIAVARCGGMRHPTFALWPLAATQPLRRALVGQGQRRVVAFIDGRDHIDVDFPPLPLAGGGTADPFFNVNTPRDLAEAERLSRSLA